MSATVTLNNLHILNNVSISGAFAPRSQDETVEFFTPIFCASSACDKPDFFLYLDMFAWMFFLIVVSI